VSDVVRYRTDPDNATDGAEIIRALAAVLVSADRRRQQQTNTTADGAVGDTPARAEDRAQRDQRTRSA